jgi:hypothetical protein
MREAHAKLLAPAPYGFIAYDDPTFKEKFFNVA